MDVRSVFDAIPRSIEQAMGVQGRGYYIPSYQRPYAWTKNDVGDLITRVCDGIVMMAETDDAVTFIGTFIFIHDKEYATVEPQVRPELPAAVYTVIDGQQRLSTLSIVAVALHDAINRMAEKIIEKRTGDVINRWITQQRQELCSRLELTFCLDNYFGDVHLRWYPRIIRAYDDTWGQQERTAVYNSPVASLLSQYIASIHKTPDGVIERGEPFVFKAGSSDLHREFDNIYRHIIRTLKQLVEREARNDEDDEMLPELRRVIANTDLQRRFFRNELPDEILQELRSSDPGARTKKVQQFARYVIFTRYMLDRVAVTEVKVSKEEYAFDMFEALNATGQPLTAYETFKPRVINSEGLERFEKSPSAACLKTVETYLNTNPDKRQSASNSLLIPFALFQKGDKLSKHLRDQRNWLRRGYDDIAGTEGKREFVKGMAAVARFLTDCWPDVSEPFTELTSLKDMDLGHDREHVLICLDVLRRANHSITVAVLSRFHSSAIWTPPDGRAGAVREFSDAVKAVAAFFVLWRASRVGTDNIDAVHRRLMQNGDTTQKVPPLNRSAGALPNAEDLKRFLRVQLAAKSITDRASWLSRASEVPVYAQSRELTKLLLMAAAHDAIPDDSNPGFTKSGRPGVAPMLSLGRWLEEFTIEHVAPRKPDPTAADPWPSDIYIKDAFDRLGNLTLIPGPENSSMGNKTWAVKRCYLQVLAADDDETANALLKAAEKRGVVLSAPSHELMERSRHLSHVRSLAEMPDNAKWTLDFINRRTRHLLERAWERLAPWLGFEET